MRNLLFSSFILFSFFLLTIPTYAHQSGCHRWHSCPSDSGRYVCGDWGYCSGCPDNEYCRDGQPITTDITNSTTSSQPATPDFPLNNTTSFSCRGTFEGIIERVIDGDTLAIKNCDKNVRLSLVDTPEKNNIGYTEAKDFTSKLCFIGSTAIVDEDDGQKEGSYDRIVAVVHCQNKNLNSELLYNSFAKVDIRFCSLSEFSKEEWAKKYGCDTKTDMDSSITSLSNTSNGVSKPSSGAVISKPDMKEVDKTVLLDILLSLEQTKIKLDNLEDSASAISKYYSEKGDSVKASKWSEVSVMLNGVVNDINGIVTEIKQNKDIATYDFIQNIKRKISEMKVDISSIIDKVIEVV